MEHQNIIYRESMSVWIEAAQTMFRWRMFRILRTKKAS